MAGDDTVPRPVSARRFSGSHPFKLGLFSFNTYGGLTNTLAPERWQASWPNMLALTQQAEAAGLEFVLPLAGWIGHAGKAETDGYFHETMSWAAGLLAATQSIHVFATVHVPFVHPLFAAKQAMTCDHIGNGRLGLNLLAGYNKLEFEMFGVEFLEHDARYSYLREWLSIVRRLWREPEPFDFSGEHFDLKNLVSVPKPVLTDLPRVVSAGSSPSGRAFALGESDALFMVVIDIDRVAEDIAALRRAMVARPIDIYCSGHIICRATKEETKAYYDYLIHEHGDWAAGEFMRESYRELGSAPDEVLDTPEFLHRLMSGHGTLPIVGTPDEVAATIQRLHAAGINGMAFALPDYATDFEFFCAEVMPRLERLELRLPLR